MRAEAPAWRGFFETDNEQHPFSRLQRSLFYQRAKGDSDKRPFGTPLDVHAQGYEWINARRSRQGSGRMTSGW